jgi:putative membrane protein
MTDAGQTHAAVNAALNGTAAIFIGVGWWAIRRRQASLHWKMMASATVVSAIFLVSYLLRVYLFGTHRYPGHGGWRTLYLAVLLSHMTLAVATPPLVLRTLYLAGRKRIAEHRRIVRFTLPVWMYVSVTGVAVYWLLYHPPG